MSPIEVVLTYALLWGLGFCAGAVLAWGGKR